MATGDSQFDVSAKERELILKRAALKQSLKAEFLKKATNPQRSAPGGLGYIFDPAIQRYLSMKATRVDHFTPTMAGLGRFFLVYVIPIGGTTWLLRRHRQAFDQQCRRGEIPYRDRNFKFIS